MKKNYLKSIFTLVVLLIVSCEDTITVEVPTAASRLVIEASLDWVKGTSGADQTIKLSRSTSYFTSDPLVPATGAVVQVTDETTQTIYHFIDQDDGNYIIEDFVPVLNRSYTLTILYEDETYTAQETMMPVTDIIRVEQETQEVLGEEEIHIKTYIVDPSEESNFYFSKFENATAELDQLLVLDDRYNNGNELMFEYGGRDYRGRDCDDCDLSTGSTILIKIFGISAQYFTYMFTINSQAPFQTIPATTLGNCYNQTNPDNYPYGFFRLSEVSQTTYVVQ